MPATKKSKKAHKAPFRYRLAARAIHTSHRIRVDHGDDKLADLLLMLGEELQNITTSYDETMRFRAFFEARPDARLLTIALRALDEIAQNRAPSPSARAKRAIDTIVGAAS